MSYTEFESLFLVAAYAESQASTSGRVSSGDVLAKYDLTYQPVWVHNCISDWGQRGWIRGKGVMGDENSQPIMFTGSGLIEAERRIGKGWEAELRQPAAPELSPSVAQPWRIVKSTGETQVIVSKMYEASDKLSLLGLSQTEESQARAYMAASIAIGESPNPVWEIVKEILMVISVIAGVGSLIAGILALI